MKDDHQQVLMEDLSSKLDRVLEATKALSVVPARLTAIEARLDTIEGQTQLIPVIKAAVTDQTRQLTDHEVRIMALEQPA